MTAVSDDRRTRTVTRGHLEEALAALERAIKNPPVTPAECVGRLSDLATRAATLDDIARTLAEDRGDAACAEMLSWVEAVSAAVQTHQRDIERLMPWAAVGRIDVMLPQTEGAETSGLGLLFDSIPTLADLPDLCEAAIGSVTEHRLQLAGRKDAGGDPMMRAAALIDALERSARAARSIERRLVEINRMAREMFDAMDFSFLFDPSRQLLSDRLSRCGQQSRSELL